LIPLAEDDPNIGAELDKLRGNNGGLAENGALDLLEKGNLNAALEKIKQALQYLETAEASDPSLDLDENKTFLALIAKSTANQAILKAEAVASKPNQLRKIARAEELVVEGAALAASLDYIGAVGKYQEAVREVQGIY
jgi:tetratricopeptide (TPR) repeat protein